MSVAPARYARRAVRWGAWALCGAMLRTTAAQAELVDVLPRIKPSIVAVGTFQPTRSPAFHFLGTGFAVGDGNVVATNAHVLPKVIAEDKLEFLAVVLPGDDARSVRRASAAAWDRNSDLALLRIEGAPLPALRLAGGALVAEGRGIAFTGFPIGSALGLSPVTHRGIIAAVTPIGIPQANAQQLTPAVIRRLTDGAFHIYQLDATAYPGNSGSPVFDADTGEVLGVLNMVFVKGTKENVLSSPSGISYAIPVGHLKTLMQALR